MADFRGVRLDPSFDWSSVVVVTAADLPRPNFVRIVRDEYPILAAAERRNARSAVRDGSVRREGDWRAASERRRARFSLGGRERHGRLRPIHPAFAGHLPRMDYILF
jgi:hypothetical protein